MPGSKTASSRPVECRCAWLCRGPYVPDVVNAAWQKTLSFCKVECGFQEAHVDAGGCHVEQHVIRCRNLMAMFAVCRRTEAAHGASVLQIMKSKRQSRRLAESEFYRTIKGPTQDTFPISSSITIQHPASHIHILGATIQGPCFKGHASPHIEACAPSL